MNPLPPPQSRAFQAVARLILTTGAVLAALATGTGAAPAAPARHVRAQGAATGPLDGAWRTFANGDRINRLVRDGDTLWSATEGGGLVRWDLTAKTYRQFLAPQDGLLSNVVSDVAVLDDGTVWAATDGGLARFDEGSKSFVTLTTVASPGMPANVVTALEPAPDNRLWVGFAQQWDSLAVDDNTHQPGTFRPGGVGLFDIASGTWDRSQEYHAEVVSSPVSGGTSGSEKYKDLVSENVTAIEYGSDGILWFGTRPYYVWDSNVFAGEDPGAPRGFWVLSGGGLAAHLGDRWKSWRASDAAASCYSNYITTLAPDVHGRMWVATAGKGLLVMRNGLGTAGCGTGQAYYVRPQRSTSPGLRGNYVWSVDIDDQGRVWAGVGESRLVGTGISILDHHETFEDSSGSRQPWQSDDAWTAIDLDDTPGRSDALVSALAVRLPGDRYLGTRDEASGDGFGLRRYIERTRDWTPLTTAANGLPGNQITAITRSPVGDETWFAFRNRGVARFDGQMWRSWRMFGAGAEAGTVNQDLAATERGRSRIPVDIATREAFDAAFPGTSRYARIGDDPVLYRVTSYVIQRGNLGPFIDVTPKQTRAVKSGTPIFAVDRGPASDASTKIAVDQSGRVWIGGRETVWLGTACPADRASQAECWLDGGLGLWDGAHWTVFWQDQLGKDANAIPDQEVQSVLVDRKGRIWAGTGNARQSEGDGIGVYDPATAKWTRYNKTSLGKKFGGNGIAGLALDPNSGDVWAVHHSATVCERNSPFGGDTCSPSRIGGGVSRFDGATWQAWTKPSANLRAFGNEGDLSAIVIDRGRERVWVSGFDADSKTMHWNTGVGVNAVVNWCSLPCTDGGWQSNVWPEEGEVVALALDSRNNLWAGVHRSGKGTTPPVAGVKLFDGAAWHEYTPRNSGLVSHEITALAPDGDDMWVGSLTRGVSLYLRIAPPTPTPRATITPRPTTPAPATATLEPTPTARANTQSACGPDRWCAVYLPFAWQPLFCRDCPRPTAPTGRTLTPEPTVDLGPTDEPVATEPAIAQSACGPDRWCEVYLPFSWKPSSCRDCPRPTAPPAPASATATTASAVSTDEAAR